jgi:hypothetical protein
VSPNFLRVVGFLFLVGAAVMAILNLHRVADLRMPWAAPLFLIIGAAFMIFSRRAKA